MGDLRNFAHQGSAPTRDRGQTSKKQLSPQPTLPSRGASSPWAAPTLPSPAQGSRGRARLPLTLLPAALMTSDGRYVLNGDWSIAWPGPYEAAGTRLLYARSPDGTESLEAAGPTAEDLHVLVSPGGGVGPRAAAPQPCCPPPRPELCPCLAQVLLQEPNPGIEYEFWLPRGHPQPPDTSPLRQPQPRGAGSPPPEEPPVPTPPPRTQSHTTEPPRTPPGRSGVAAGACTPPPMPSCTHGCCCGRNLESLGGGAECPERGVLPLSLWDKSPKIKGGVWGCHIPSPH